MTCSPGLLWNGIKNECDFPENVNCDLSSDALAKHKVVKTSLGNARTSLYISNTICRNNIGQVSSGSYIYMTFDDGPNEGTPYVLDALKEVQILRILKVNQISNIKYIALR